MKLNPFNLNNWLFFFIKKREDKFTESKKELTNFVENLSDFIAFYKVINLIRSI